MCRTNSIYDHGAERAVIGCLLHDNDWIAPVMCILPESTSFHSEFLRLTYKAILELYQDKGTADVITVADILRRKGKRKNRERLVEAIENRGHGPPMQYAEIVAERSRLRRLYRIGHNLQESASRNETDSLDLMTTTQMEIANLSHSSNYSVAASSLVADAITEINNYSTGEAQKKLIYTGFSNLDQILWGLHPSRLYIIAGRPGQGKTQLGLQIAAKVAQGGSPVWFLSLEMSNSELMFRLLRTLARVDGKDIHGQNLDSEQWNGLTVAQNKVASMPIFFSDPGTIKIAELSAQAERLIVTEKVSLILVDYLQLIDGGKHENRNQEVAHISRSLKRIAKDNCIPVVALSQLKRLPAGVVDRPPTLSDLRDSGALEQDADVVIFTCHRPKGEREIIVAKHRHGECGKVEMSFIQGRWEQKAHDQQATL